MSRAPVAFEHASLGLGVAMSVLAVLSCASESAASPGPKHAEANCDERWNFQVPSYVDARTCVRREEVEALVRSHELQALSIRPPGPDDSRPTNPTALYVRVEIVPRKSGYQTHVDAVGREGYPGYSNGDPTRGFVTLERVYEDRTLPEEMILCEPTRVGCRCVNDVRQPWCVDAEIEPGLKALRIVATGVPPVELPRPEHPPEIEAYFADSPDGRLLIQIRAEAGPLAAATLRVDHLQASPLYRIPITHEGERDCFYDLRGTSQFKHPFSAAVMTPLTWQALGPAEAPLPEARSDRARFGPLKQNDFDLLLMAHEVWLESRVPAPKFERGDWQSMHATRVACPDRPAAPTRAVLDGVDLVGLKVGGKQLTRASMRDAGLAHADLDKSDLCGADLRDSDLQRARALTIRLQDATLDRVDARHADFWGNMDRSTWRGADLRGANLGGSLVAADFANADLRGARLYGDLSRANFQRARLEGVRFVDANLRGALGLTQPQLDAACAEAGTRLPSGLHVHACD